MNNKVMVCRVQTGATLVTVPIVLNGDEVQCIFITRKGELARVGIFDANPRETGPFWIFESYTRRVVPVEAIRDAHKRAREALDELERQTERATSFDCAMDISTAHAVQGGG